MTTYADLTTKVARTLQDPSAKTFTTQLIDDITQASLAVVGRVAPRRFQQDLTPIDNQIDYSLLVADFPDGQAGIEVQRVEVWDGSQTPHLPISFVDPIAAEYSTFSQGGWAVWGSTLSLPRGLALSLVGRAATYLIRVWGYAPYPTLGGTDALPFSKELEEAVVAYSRVEGLQRLNASRDLFTQWQTRSGNTDMSPAGLMNALSQAQEDWRRTARAIAVLREAP